GQRRARAQRLRRDRCLSGSPARVRPSEPPDRPTHRARVLGRRLGARPRGNRQEGPRRRAQARPRVALALILLSETAGKARAASPLPGEALTKASPCFTRAERVYIARSGMSVSCLCSSAASAGRGAAGSCSTVQRCPSHRRVTSTICPLGKFHASLGALGCCPFEVRNRAGFLPIFRFVKKPDGSSRSASVLIPNL